jgi:hypothetical protein
MNKWCKRFGQKNKKKLMPTPYKNNAKLVA